MPALTHLEGPYLDLVRDALYAPAAKERGLFRPEAVDAAARRPQRPADAAARQRAVADRAARTVAAAARHHRGRGMTASPTERRPSRGDHPRPARRVAAAPGRRDGRRRGARTRLGPADFRPDLRRRRTSSPRCCAAKAQGRRDICIYAREPHVLVARAPAELFIDPSHTYRLRFAGRRSGAADVRVHGAHAGGRRRRRRDEPRLRALRDGARAGRRHLGQPPHRDPVDYLVAVRDDDGTVVGTVTGVDHKRLFSDPENGSSLWTLAVDPTASLPGVGAALTRALAAIYRDRRPGLHGPVGGARQRGRDRALREAGIRTGAGDGGQAQERDQRTAVHPPAGDRRRPQSVRAHHRRRGHAPRHLGGGARRRGRRDAAVARRSQRHHPRVVVGVHLRCGDEPAATTSA